MDLDMLYAAFQFPFVFFFLICAGTMARYHCERCKADFGSDKRRYQTHLDSAQRIILLFSDRNNAAIYAEPTTIEGQFAAAAIALKVAGMREIAAIRAREREMELDQEYEAARIHAESRGQSLTRGQFDYRQKSIFTEGEKLEMRLQNMERTGPFQLAPRRRMTRLFRR
jgi:hypothetical protein